MPAVPLGQKAYKRTDGFVPEVRLVNLWLEKDDSGISPDGTLRVMRPGLVRRDTYGGAIRAAFLRSKNNQELIVAANALLADSAASGFLPGSELVPMAETAFYVAMAAQGQPYLFDTTLQSVAVPDGRYVSDLDQLNGYVLLLNPDGRFYWIEPGETTIDPLNFATAESSPDGALAIRRLGDEFWIFGKSTVEPWQPTGDADAPWQRASGRVYERGCLHRDTVRRFDNSIVWVGEDCIVYRGGAVPEAISDDGISERIRKRTGNPSAWVFGMDGHKMYVLRIPGQGTFGFDASTKSWSEFASDGRDTWLAHVGYESNGMVVAGSWLYGGVYTLDGSGYRDDGQAMPWAVTGTVAVGGKSARNDSLTIGVGASADCTVNIRWKDGQEDYPAYSEQIDIRAPFDLANVWRLGMPEAPYRTFEVSGPTPARVRIAGMMANEAWA